MNGELLSALLDGELSPAEEAEVLAHLAGCDHCAEELVELRRVRTLVRELPWLDPPVAVARPAPRRLAAAAAAALAAAAAVLFAVAAPDPQPVRPSVARLVDVHATSGVGADPVTELTPAAVPVGFEE